MDYELPAEKQSQVKPRIIIHGGAGNITPKNLPTSSYNAYRDALLSIAREANAELQRPHATALDIATYAVSMLEDNPLFNAGRGAVYTDSGTHELEASVMVSRGHRKRGVGVMKVTRSKSPIKLAREMLIRGDWPDGGGAANHCQLEGEICDQLNAHWGLESVKPSYYWTRRRWDEHRRGLGLSHDDETYEKQRRAIDNDDTYEKQRRAISSEGSDPIDNTTPGPEETHWNGKEYLPQGTVGAVVLDSSGTLCAATSTGGLTNKLPGRIGDTPTLGAGFWAEEWLDSKPMAGNTRTTVRLGVASSWLTDCIPGLGYTLLAHSPRCRAVAMSGTGNGDSFLRCNAVRTAAAIARYASHPSSRTGAEAQVSLQAGVTAVAGPNGQLQQSAGDRWNKTGEGEGGIIGIELVDGKGEIVFDWNCGGMFHAWVTEHGEAQFEVFRNQSLV